MKKTIASGSLLLVCLCGCTGASVETIPVGSRTPKSPPTEALAPKRRSKKEVIDRLQAAGLDVRAEVKIALDVVAPFGIEHSEGQYTIQGEQVTIYEFYDSWQAQKAATKLPSVIVDVDYIQLDSLLVVVPKSDQGARILSALPPLR